MEFMYHKYDFIRTQYGGDLMNNMILKKENKIPLYMDIKNYVIDLINKNGNTPNYKLPSENQLANKFNVSRITAKNALTILESENLIYRIQGKGTFVNTEHSASERRTLTPNFKVVYLLIPSMESMFTSLIVAGASEFCSEINIPLFTVRTKTSQEYEKLMINVSLELGAAGFLIMPIDGEVYSQEILKLAISKFPIVLIDRFLPGLDLNCVSTNHYQAAYDATKHLIVKGHKRIGFMYHSTSDTTSVKNRIKGYETALLENLVPVNETYKLELDKISEEDVEEEIHNYLKANSFTAVISISGVQGLPLFKTLKKHNIKSPNDIEIIIFDDEYSDYKEFLQNDFSVINQYPYKIGYSAAELLNEKMASTNDKFENIYIPHKLSIENK